MFCPITSIKITYLDFSWCHSNNQLIISHFQKRNFLISLFAYKNQLQSYDCPQKNAKTHVLDPTAASKGRSYTFYMYSGKILKRHESKLFPYIYTSSDLCMASKHPKSQANVNKKKSIVSNSRCLIPKKVTCKQALVSNFGGN